MVIKQTVCIVFYPVDIGQFETGRYNIIKKLNSQNASHPVNRDVVVPWPMLFVFHSLARVDTGTGQQHKDSTIIVFAYVRLRCEFQLFRSRLCERSNETIIISVLSLWINI